MLFQPIVDSGYSLLDQVHYCDLLTLASALPAQSVDMILTDLPYGATACSWDEIIPFEPMWDAFKRVIKPQGAIVLTATQPFASRLVSSNLGMFRYEWIWEKSMAGGFPNAPLQPLRAHEQVLVFSIANAFSGNIPNPMTYYPQMEKGKPYFKKGRSGASVMHGRDTLRNDSYIMDNDGMRFPRSVLKIANPNHKSIHPTQKPVSLFEYLIKTYTRPDELVVDFCSGSGTTAIAARNTGRHFICGDNGTDDRTGKTWALIAIERLHNADPMQSRTVAPNTVQHSLFESIDTEPEDRNG